MSLHARLRRALADPQLRLATAFGLASVPITVALSWGAVTDERIVAGGTVSAAAYLVVGLLVGYLYYDRPTERRAAGTRAGLAASVGMVVVYLANMVSTLDPSDPRATAFVLVGTPLAIAVGVAITVLVVRAAALVGDRFAAVRSWRAEARDGPTGAREEVPNSRWWLSAVGYAVFLPVTVGFLFGLDPDGFVGALLAVLMWFVAMFTAALALFGVYKDAKEFHEAGSPWIPNVAAYVGVPVAAFVAGHYLAAYNAWEAPVSMLGFLGACWLAAVVYLFDRRRAVAAA
ncbi:DUF5518 domain-containing protein [Halogeometricum luteum]|uniref:Uncharacterized protein n=1 Tax=Halogeometricum luteum TaxID=2950537 RepID=A0ABU2G2J0_9EURY|nr:DUF5518 domain-containing protein [Halogeometricum sp. S3BR5-2]MDS0295001.1 hypothetical protein [Halogeometricum sp. S3BR5-2]